MRQQRRILPLVCAWIGLLSIAASAQKAQFVLLLPTHSLGRQASLDAQPHLIVQVGHAGWLTSGAFSPDGRNVLTGSEDGSSVLWEVASGRELRKFEEHTADAQVDSVAFSQDGRFVETANNTSKTVRLWEASTGRELQQFEGVSPVAFSPDGRYLLAGSGHGSVWLWEVSTGQKVREYAGPIVSATFSRDGRYLLEGRGDGSVRLFEVWTGQEVRQLLEGTDPVDSVTFSPDERFLLTGTVTGGFVHTAWLWETATLRMVKRFNETSHGAFSPDGKFVLTDATLDGSAHLWETATAREVRQFGGSTSGFSGLGSVAFSPEGRFVLTTPRFDRTALLWETSTGRLVRRFGGQAYEVPSVAFSPDGHFVLTGSGGGGAHLLDASTGHEVRQFEERDWVNSVAFSRDGQFVLTGSKTARLWETATGSEIQRFKTERDAISSVAISPDGQFVLTGSFDELARLWEVSTGRLVRQFTEEDKEDLLFLPTRSVAFCPVAFSPDGRFALTGNRISKVEDYTPQLWETATGLAVQRFEGHTKEVHSFAFSPDGQFVLTGSWDKTARLWETATGREVQRLEGHTSSVDSVAFSPDGQFVLTGSWDKTARLWEVATGRAMQRFEGHTGHVDSVAFSPDGRYVLSGSSDGTTRLWDARTGKELVQLVSFGEAGWAVIAPNGRFDTNNLDEIKGFSWVFPDDPLRALAPEIFMRDYYEPQLLQRLLAGENFRPLLALGILNRVQPVVEVEKAEWNDAAAGIVEVTVKVKHNNDPEMPNGKTVTDPYDLRLFRDGQLVGWAPRRGVEWQLMPPPTGPNADELDLERWREKTHIDLAADGTTELSFKVRVPRRTDMKQVTFTAYAFNVDRVKSATASKTLEVKQLLNPRVGKAYVISVGVNWTESSPNWNLQYAANDARQMSAVVGDKLEATKQFAQVVQIRLVSDEAAREQPEEGAATKAHVQAVLDVLSGRRLVDEQLKQEIPGIEKAEKAQPEDLVLLTFSSHGYADDRGVFHMVLADIGKGQPQDRITHELQKRALSSDELSAWLRDVDAGELVMVVDSCHSSATVEAEGFKPGPMGSRGLGQLAYDKGMRILAASKSGQSAIELGGDIREGLLTYALVHEGLEEGKADFQPKDGKILMSEWLAYGAQEVPNLFKSGKAKGPNGEKPTVRTSRDIIYLGPDQAPPGYQQPVLFDFGGRKGIDVQLVCDK